MQMNEDLQNDPYLRVALLLAKQSNFDAKTLYEQVILDEITNEQFWQGVKEKVKDPKLLNILDSAEKETYTIK